MSNTRASGLLILAALLWGLSNVPQKTVLDDVGAFTAVGLRCLIGAVVILPFVWRDLAGPARIDRRTCVRFLEVALLFTGAILLQQFASGATTVTNAGFLISTTTVMTPLVAWWLLRERPAAAIWISVAAALAGALMMSSGAIEPFAPGDFIGLASAALYSLWFVRLGTLVCETGRSGLVALAQFMLAGFAALLLGLAMENVTRDSLEAASTDLLLLGILGTGLPFGLQAIAQKYVTAPAAAILISSESVFGAAAAAILLGERLTPGMWAGAALVLLSIIALQIGQPATGPVVQRRSP